MKHGHADLLDTLSQYTKTRRSTLKKAMPVIFLASKRASLAVLRKSVALFIRKKPCSK
ncbi:MAG: hypothetical protein Q8O38_16610 [Sulfurimicrobium sp.]|nr:hypothetical protein [Sulfurimicrobium sp.]